VHFCPQSWVQTGGEKIHFFSTPLCSFEELLFYRVSSLPPFLACQKLCHRLVLTIRDISMYWPKWAMNMLKNSCSNVNVFCHNLVKGKIKSRCFILKQRLYRGEVWLPYENVGNTRQKKLNLTKADQYGRVSSFI